MVARIASPEHRARSQANARLAALEARVAELAAENRALKTPRPKCERLLAEGRVAVLSADEDSIVARVLGDSGTYTTAIYRDDSGRLVRECDCENAQFHPVRPRCSHVQAVERIWRGAQR